MFYYVSIKFIRLAGKLINEVAAGCANGEWWAGFGNSACGSETLGLIIFAFIIFIAIFLPVKLVEWEIL